MTQSIIYNKAGDVLVGVLDRDMRVAGVPIDGLAWLSDTQQVRVDYQDSATSAQVAAGAALVAAHVPVDPIQQVRDGAEQEARDIPNWATWTEAEVIAWWETNVNTPLVTGRAALPATIPLSAAGMTVVRTAIIRILDVLDMMATMLWAMARMVIALRNNTWPNLQNPPAGLRK